MVRQSSQGCDDLVRDEERHRRRSVLGGVRGPVRRSGVRRSEAIQARLGSGVAFPAAIYGFDAVASIKLRDGRPRSTLPHVSIPTLRPEATKVLGGVARMVWSRLRALDLGGTGGGLLHIVVHALDFIDVGYLKQIRSQFQLLNIAAL